MTSAHRRAGWRKSTYSAQADGCVEVNPNDAVAVLLRPGSWTVREVSTGTELVFDEQEWTAFRLGAKDGEFSVAAIDGLPPGRVRH